MSGLLEGGVAIVTGAGRGFGRAIATRLAREGFAVALIARTEQQIAGVASEINAAGGRAVAIAADATDGVSGELRPALLRSSVRPI